MDPEIAKKICSLETREAASSIASSDIATVETANNSDVYKVIVIGDVGVGKASLLQRMKTGDFTEDLNATVGVEFVNYNLIIGEHDFVRLQVWDTAGQEKFRVLTRNFYKESDAVFMIYSITSRKSFESLKTWNQDIEDNTK